MRAQVVVNRCFNSIVGAQQINHVCLIRVGEADKGYATSFENFEAMIGSERFVIRFEASFISSAPRVQNVRLLDNIQTKCKRVAILFSEGTRADQMGGSMVQFLSYRSSHEVNEVHKWSLRW